MFGFRKNDYARHYEYSLFRPRRKKRSYTRWIKWLLFFGVVGAGIFWFQSDSRFVDAALDLLPVPHKLVAVHLEINGKGETLREGAQRIVTPSDAVRIVSLETDGWLKWGVSLSRQPVDWNRMTEKAERFKDLFPKETFESPRSYPLRALWWNRPLGAVTFVVKLSARDWIRKAAAAEAVDDKVRYLEHAIKEDPENVLAKTRLAALYVQQKRLVDAEKLYKDVLAMGRSRPILERLVDVYRLQKKHRAALETYLEILSLSDDSRVFEQLVDYLRSHLSLKRALAFVEKEADKVPERYRGAWQLVRAELATRLKRWGVAAKAYEAALRYGIRDPNIHYNLSVVRAKTGDLRKAASDLEHYLAANPADEKNWLKLGALYEKMGRDAKARRVYEKVVQRNPKSKVALIRLVALLQKTDDKEGLLRAYEKLAVLEPQDSLVQFNKAVLYYQLNRWEEAEAAFRKAAELDPANPEPLRYLLDLYRKKKDAEKEIQVLRRLIRMDKDNLSYYDALFMLYDQAGNYDAIVQFFSEAVQDHPKVTAFYQYILYGALKKGDQKKALQILETLSRMLPKDIKYLRQAARIHESLGQYKKALEKTKQILERAPEDEQAKKDYMRLRLLLLGQKKTGFFYCNPGWVVV